MTHIEDRLRSFARLITQNFDLKVHFVGTIPSISKNEMFIPPLEDTPQAFRRAKFFVGHECGHDLHTVMHLKRDANKESIHLGDILNSLEDARIERLMVQQFEGLKDEFDVNVKQIMDEIDFDNLPLHEQVLHGMYLEGTGMDTAFLATEAKAYLAKLYPLIQAAVQAKDTYEVLRVSRKVKDAIKGILPPAKKKKNSDNGTSSQKKAGHPPTGFKSIPDRISDKLNDHTIKDDKVDWERYKNCIDGVVPEKETLTSADQGSLKDYLQLVEPYLFQQSYLIQHIEALVDKKRGKKRKMAFQRHKNTGIVDTRSVWKIATNETAIFKSRQRTDARVLYVDSDSLAFYILMDLSMSMSWLGRMPHAKAAVATLGEVLSKLSIPFAITGYSTKESILRRVLFKQFDEPYSEVRTRLVNAMPIEDTFTSEHIPFAVRRLQERKERKKILLMITDVDGIESEYRLERAIAMVKADGIPLLGVGICTNMMAKYFDRYIELHDLSNFASGLLGLLRDVLR